MSNERPALEIKSVNYIGKDASNDFAAFECNIGTEEPVIIGFSPQTSAKFMVHLIDSMRTDGKGTKQQRMLSVDENDVPNSFPLKAINAFRIDQRQYALQIDIGDGLLVPVSASRVEIRRAIDLLSKVIDAPLNAN